MNVVSLFQNILYQYYALAILTKHFSCTMTLTSAVRSVTGKLARISFSFFTISQVKDLFLLSVLATSAYDFFSFLIKLRTFICSLKGSTYCFPLACGNGQHHYPGTLGPPLNKPRASWTGAPWYRNSQAGNLAAAGWWARYTWKRGDSGPRLDGAIGMRVHHATKKCTQF